MKTVKWGQNFPETFNYDKASCINLLNMKLKVKTNTGNTHGYLTNMKTEKLQWEHNIHLIIEKENICLSQKEKEKFDFCLKRSKFNNVL